MQFLWMLIFSAQPWTLLPAVLGWFGKDAEDAAETYGIGVAIVLVIILVLVVIYQLGLLLTGS
ncbi:MAG: hypothetical protein K2W95_15940 [Candidatus Obscuribacterales bacterium]|nr:hypothetical protein [Candidatus Obscuribacterales bacterium]